MSEIEIREWVKRHATISSGILLLNADQAAKVIDMLVDAGLPIDGVEGLIFNERGTQPDSDLSLSITDLPLNARRPVEWASYLKAFISHREVQDLYFEVIF